MTNIHGIDKLLIAVGDTDGLIATLYSEDKNFLKAKKTVEDFIENEIQVIFPLTTIVEAITTLKRKLNKAEIADYVIKQITGDALVITNVNTEILKLALTFFDIKGSKQNTLFDAIVAASAKKLNTKIIFSFDEWYEKLGFKLAYKSI